MNAKHLSICFVLILFSTLAFADTRMVIHHSDFESTDQFNSLNFFGFEIIFEDELGPGEHVNPPISYLEYHIVGLLPMDTPSGINVFHLTRIMDGDEFYGQGSSMQFEIVEGADFCDGLQFNELVDGFVMNAVELGTGQYHSPIFELHSDGTGSIQNASNSGGVNEETGQVVDLEVGEEYSVTLQFDPVNYAIVPQIVGDVNADCSIDLLDVQPFVSAITDPSYDFAADMNGDGADNLLDVFFFVHVLIGS